MTFKNHPNKNLLDNSYIVSLDVRFLYISIPNYKSIEAVKASLENFPRRTVATKVITTFLPLILMLNNFFSTAKTIYKQKVAP